MSTSKKRGKGTKKKNFVGGNFSQLLAPGLKQVFTMFPKSIKWSHPPQNPKIYPGAVIPMDEFDDLYTSGSKWFLSKEHMEAYYANLWKNAVPLDLDLVEAVLQHWKWLEEFKQQVAEKTALLVAVENFSLQFRSVLDTIYMEALWRKINKKSVAQT